ncbi:ABC transporter ATP-binding protein [Hoyosella subflava]|uniref:ABC transporter-like protein n=1 Tax=Hoyosella subflava (strain DSM 45089 / JCM 17490 / NBRC 109087 / DQS3-9A1) TaxID=443218 RepID=F6EQ33_HOYSD|nr:ABC transporter ATP-binding protein [Hoyosella subflava]AEF41854.1 ABC transporter-like protein [Hoyosella subflava DQS3-9A1]
MNGESPSALNVSALHKSFGHAQALRGLDLDVPAGTVHGFLGPNGAGKSTTIRVLLGLIRRDSGEVTVLGGDPVKDAMEIHRRTAYVPGDVALWPGLTGGETLDIIARIRGGFDAQLRADLIERFALDPTKKVSSYSKGNRQKVALIGAFAAAAELLILDEPTTGLDPLMYAVFADCVREAARRGATVLLSSHILSEVEQLCDATTIIRDGRTVQTGSLRELRHLTRTHISAHTQRHPGALDRFSGVTGLRVDRDGAGFAVQCDAEPAALSSVVAELGAADVRELTCAPPTLEDLFLAYYSSDAVADPEGSLR